MNTLKDKSKNQLNLKTMTTTDLSKFGMRELAMAGELLKDYGNNRNLTRLASDYFSHDGVTVMMNTMSGNVFLTNEEFEVLMFNDDGKLDLFINTPYEGHEGFLTDLMEEYDDMNPEDQEYLDTFKEYLD